MQARGLSPAKYRPLCQGTRAKRACRQQGLHGSRRLARTAMCVALLRAPTGTGAYKPPGFCQHPKASLRIICV